MNINIELDQDQLAAIVTTDLKDTVDYFNRMLTNEQPNIFSLNPITDKIIIMKHLEAFKLVLEWYE